VKARIIPDLSNRDYHAHPAFGSSQLKAMLRNPARFRWERENPQPPTTAMQLGSLVHTLLLEPEHLEVEYLVVETSTRNTKAYRAALEEAGGRAVMLAGELETARAMADAARADPWVAELLQHEAMVEHSIFWEEGSMELKARPDWWAPEGLSLMVDVKTASDASEEAFTRAVVRYGYDLSAAHYLEAAALAGRPTETFAWLVIESSPPHTVQVYIAPDTFLERGRILRERALVKLRECLEANTWPGYAEGPIELTMPAWAALEEML